MLTDFVVSRNDPEVTKLARKNFFENVKVPKVVKETEKIPETLKRVLGDDFVELKDLYIIEGIIQNECIFDPKAIKNNTKNLSFITQGISNIFQGFMGVIGNTATKELVDSTEATLCISSTSDNYTETKITLNDLGEIAEYINGVPMTLKNYKAIVKLTNDIGQTEQALQKAPDQETANSLNKKRNDYYQQLTEYYNDLVVGFLRIIKEKTGIDYDKIVDVTTVFDKSTTSDTGEVIKVKSFVMLHSIYNILYRELEESLI